MMSLYPKLNRTSAVLLAELSAAQGRVLTYEHLSEALWDATDREIDQAQIRSGQLRRLREQAPGVQVRVRKGVGLQLLSAPHLEDGHVRQRAGSVRSDVGGGDRAGSGGL